MPEHSDTNQMKTLKTLDIQQKDETFDEKLNAKSLVIFFPLLPPKGKHQRTFQNSGWEAPSTITQESRKERTPG